MKNESPIGGGLELIFFNKVPRFRIGTCLGGGLELLKETHYTRTQKHRLARVTKSHFNSCIRDR